MSKIGGIAAAWARRSLPLFPSPRSSRPAGRSTKSEASSNLSKHAQAVTGDTALAAKNFDSSATKRCALGVAFDSSAQAYAKLAAASKEHPLKAPKPGKFFTAVSEASRVLGLSSYESEGALNALQQMMSTGTVQAEELRGQLGERIPGAFNLAAKAMGVTTKELGKMMEQGEVLAEDLLPRLAQVLRSQYAAGLEEATHTAAA
jgi:tape measure domain-containing protein